MKIKAVNESRQAMDKRKTANKILGAAFTTCLVTAPFQGNGLWQAGLFHVAFAATVGAFLHARLKIFTSNI